MYNAFAQRPEVLVAIFLFSYVPCISLGVAWCTLIFAFSFRHQGGIFYIKETKKSRVQWISDLQPSPLDHLFIGYTLIFIRVSANIILSSVSEET